jgi:hypothetical protein
MTEPDLAVLASRSLDRHEDGPVMSYEQQVGEAESEHEHAYRHTDDGHRSESSRENVPIEIRGSAILNEAINDPVYKAIGRPDPRQCGSERTEDQPRKGLISS